MKIAALSRSIPAHGGGGMERVAWDLLIELAELGHEVVCVTTPTPSPIGDAPLKVRFIDGPAGRYSDSWWSQTPGLVDEIAPDVVLGISAGAHAVLEQGSFSGPVVMQAHGTALEELKTKLRVHSFRSLATMPRQARAMLRDLRLYPKYAAVIAVGQAVETALQDYPQRTRPQRVELITNGVPEVARLSASDRSAAKSHFGLQADRPVAAFIGRVHREKGVDILLDAVRSWNGHALVVGSGPELDSLKSHPATAAGKATFTGWAEREDVRIACAAADVVVLPSRRLEGLPIVALEALAHRTAIIATPQIALNFGNDTTGVLVADTNSSAVRARLDEAVALTSGESVQLPEQFSIKFAARTYARLFEELG